MMIIVKLFILSFISILAESTGPKLLFANRKDIRVIDIQKGKISKSILVKDVNDAASVDYYYRKKEVCWTDIDKEFIKCVTLDKTDGKSKNLKQIKLIDRGITSPDGMAIDWLTEKLYWADSEMNKIEVAELYGQNRKLLYWDNLDQPRAIALAPSEGIMFWSDWGKNPKIERAGMDGDAYTRKEIITTDCLWPNGLTIDFENKRIFWADGKLFSISSADFDGLNRIKVLGDLKHPFAISYYDYSLYWTDWSTESIHYCHLNSKSQCENHHQLTIKLSPMYIHVYDQSRQVDQKTPCSQNNGGCSHLCLLAPAPRNYSCSCPTGVKLKDPVTCEDGPKEMLLLARRSDLRRISLDTPDHTPVVLPVNNICHAIAVDYDPVDQFFYWTDDEAYWIQRARLNGSDQEILIQSDGLDFDGVAIDWLARNLYWSDTENNRIEVARIDGSYRKILLLGGLEKPRAIALFPEGGLMFFTDWGDKPKIERANLDGSDRLTIVSTKLGWPNGVAVDSKELKIYWVDASTRVIETSELDGNNRKIILGENLPHAFGFSLLGDFLYWTDWQKRSIERVHKKNASYREVLVDQLPDVMGLKALSINQEIGYSPCVKNNGGCSHLCFNKPDAKYVCDCPLELELSEDEKSCVIPAVSVLYSQHESIRRLSLETYKDIVLPIPRINEISSLDYDNQQRLYWSDTNSKKIYRSYINGTKPTAIVEFGMLYPAGLAVDWVAQNIYWTDEVMKRIEMSTVDGFYRKVIAWNVTQPRSLVVDPLRGHLYWSDKDRNGERIVRSSLDGMSSKAIISNDLQHVNSIVLDFNSSRLFWIDIEQRRIESSTLQGEDRKVLIRSLDQPKALIIYGDHIFWSNYLSQTIEMANKETGEERKIIKKYKTYVNDMLVFEAKREVFRNPCQTNNGNCSQLCIFTSNSVNRCACSTHYKLHEDGKTCLPPQDFLLYSQRSLVTRMVTDSVSSSIVLPFQLRNIQTLEFDLILNDLYWIDSKSNSIKKIRSNSSDIQTIVKQEKLDPFDLAIQSGSRLLVWACAKNNLINASRINNDGTISPVGTILGLEEKIKPRSLAIHSKWGLLFFVNLISPPVIEKLNISDLNRKILVDSNLRNPYSLVLDSEENHIYWIDSSPPVIETQDIEGNNRRTVVDVHLNRPIELAINGDYLYWIDNKLDVIERVHKRTGLERLKLVNKVNSLSSLLSVTPNRYKWASNHPCSKATVKCSHFCVLTNKKTLPSFLIPLERLRDYSTSDSSSGSNQGSLINNQEFKCECPQGMVLSPDSFTCIYRPSCPPHHFTCIANEDCIPIEWRCDGLKECLDGSDEEDCSPSECKPSSFRCDNGQCIDNNLVCDRTPDCLDGSDEYDCCTPGHSICKSKGMCVSCMTPEHCPDPLRQCLFSMVTMPASNSRGQYNLLVVIGALLAFIVLVAIIGFVYNCRRKPTMLDDQQELEVQRALKVTGSNGRVLMAGGKIYTGIQGGSEPGGSGVPNCPLNPHQPIRLSLLQDNCPPNVVNVGTSRGGVYVERTPGVIGGVSSSSSSMTHYPRETVNPPPTPTAEPYNHCLDSSHCCHGPPLSSSVASYRHYKNHNRPPPPSPCSTDLLEDSDMCSSNTAMSPPHCHSPPSCYSTPIHNYPYPPPPTPHQYELTSCPPSPSTDRSYFIEGPCPSPLSPSLSD